MKRNRVLAAGTAASVAATLGSVVLATPAHASNTVYDGDLAFYINGGGAYVSHFGVEIRYGCHAGFPEITGPNNYKKTGPTKECWGHGSDIAYDVAQNSNVITGTYCGAFWERNGSGGFFRKYLACTDVWN